jgi:hypothetical protein
MTRTLYLTRNSLPGRLGQSPFMGYQKDLYQDYPFLLVAFDKPETLQTLKAMAKAKADCDPHSIDWSPKSFHRRPKLLAPACNMFEMFWSALQSARLSDEHLIHAR